MTEQYSAVIEGLIENCDFENLVKISHIPECLIAIDIFRLQLRRWIYGEDID